MIGFNVQAQLESDLKPEIDALPLARDRSKTAWAQVRPMRERRYERYLSEQIRES